MPLVRIDLTKNSPYGLIQEGQVQSFVGYITDRLGFKTVGSKLVFGFIISNGVGRYFKIVAFDKPELFDAFATINKVVTIKAAKATCQNIYTDANNLNLSAFEFQVCDAAQVRFYVTLRRSELVLMPNYRLDIEDEEDD